ncbi:helix-turn-helix transcriptional regulator [Paenibacillus sp. YK5]
MREKKGWTQDRAAEILGISRSTLAGYESKEKNRIPREETLKKIADLFETTTDYLLGRTNDPSISIKEVNNMLNEQEMSPEDRKILEELKKLTPKDKEYVYDLIRRFKKE